MEEFLRNTTNIKETSNKEILPLYIFHLDVNDGVSVKNAIEKILTESRRIDMLVNNTS
jgi:NADP-dependent 3-hydroxy acid dehydrogenase YdfG